MTNEKYQNKLSVTGIISKFGKPFGSQPFGKEPVVCIDNIKNDNGEYLISYYWLPIRPKALMYCKIGDKVSFDCILSDATGRKKIIATDNFRIISDSGIKTAIRERIRP